MKKKEIIMPFDLAKAKVGAKLRTRSGLPVEILKWDARGRFPIRGIVIEADEDKSTCWQHDGAYNFMNTSENPLDLVIVEEVEEPKFWSDNKNNTIGGFFIEMSADIEEAVKVPNTEDNYDVFATKKQAKAALAMARISQIMANDIANFGGVITDEEWKNGELKFVIYRFDNRINTTSVLNVYYSLAFHTEKQRDLFLEKYPQLVKDYLMIPDEQTK